ncbi:hypothetical protein J2847_005111 [Azospirillum agricola]|uniref:hypothetical protein n=1 Tax=Azospirillum agricola TaxID=1720247 RepID=UPI001AE2F56D|nr:hypothetical protein [Azospirillum agricola]MBP2231792.1 hypothetical protein [Azospirillum agricola]
MTRQLDLFRKPRRPAKRNPRTLFVFDAGNPGPTNRAHVRLACDVCGHKTDWVPERSETAEKAGRVCPKCKGDPANVKPSAATEAAPTP